jgi:hypothetical protein
MSEPLQDVLNATAMLADTKGQQTDEVGSGDCVYDGWCKNLTPILNLNRQRNQMRPLLEAAALASSEFVCRLRLMEAMEVLGLEGLYAFLLCEDLELLLFSSPASWAPVCRRCSAQQSKASS